MNRTATVVPHDLYASVTARIVDALAAGSAPWVRPWSEDVDSCAMNAGTRRPYRGINALLLNLTATSQGYPLNRGSPTAKPPSSVAKCAGVSAAPPSSSGGCARSRRRRTPIPRPMNRMCRSK